MSSRTRHGHADRATEFSTTFCHRMKKRFHECYRRESPGRIGARTSPGTMGATQSYQAPPNNGPTRESTYPPRDTDAFREEHPTGKIHFPDNMLTQRRTDFRRVWSSGAVNTGSTSLTQNFMLTIASGRKIRSRTSF